jgi:hypothetical protein
MTLLCNLFCHQNISLDDQASAETTRARTATRLLVCSGFMAGMLYA